MITFEQASNNYLESENRWLEEIYESISKDIDNQSKRGIKCLGFSFNNEKYRESDRELFFNSVNSKFTELGFMTRICYESFLNKKPRIIWIGWDKTKLTK